MTWDVLLAGDLDAADFSALDDIATLTTTAAYDDEAALRADVGRFEAIVVRSYELDGDLLRAATDLRVIAKRGVGLDTIDVETATELGIVVCNTPGGERPGRRRTRAGTAPRRQKAPGRRRPDAREGR